jgi:hypothetical protein
MFTAGRAGTARKAGQASTGGLKVRQIWGGRRVALYTTQNVYSFLYPVIQNIYMDKRVLGTLGIKLQIYHTA